MASLKRFFAPKGRGKIRWTLFFIVLLFLVSLKYNLLEAYNANLESLNSQVHSVSFLKGVTLPAIHFKTWPPETFRLGLDLRGGTHLVYQADLSKTPSGDISSSIEGVRDVIERRINIFGVAEPVVQTVKVGDTYRIIVELAGVKDVSQAIKMIGDTPLLEFKEQLPQGEEPKQEGLTPEQKKELTAFNADAKKRATEALKKALDTKADFAKIAKENSEDLETRDKGGDVGWASAGSSNGYLLAAADKLKDGEVKNDILEYGDGYSVVKLLGKRNGQEVKANHVLICYTGATRCEKDTSKEEAKKKIDELKSQATPQNFVELAKKNSTEPGAGERGGDLGWFVRGAMVKAFEDTAFALKKNSISEVVETEFGYHIIWKSDERLIPEYHIARMLFKTKSEQDYLEPPSLWKDTGLTGKQLKRATVDFNNPSSSPQIALEFNDEGKKLFATLTQANVGKPIAIFLDSEPISVPTVQQPILDGSAVITGDFTLKEAKLLAQRLTTGALPVPITLLSQQTIGPSLGEESLQKSLAAGLFGFLLVALFMIFFYRLAGVLAIIALIIYTSLSLSVFKGMPVTLSLAGIAGFILSIGMAVDANILIFERMKEELRSGKKLESAVSEGFRRAWTSIRDSNVSSLITCVVLFSFSASLIKGFALTLAIGIVVSMFSAIVITRIFLKVVAGWRLAKVRGFFQGKT
ncbi:protein translocase subunit SecD [Candidatus Uhrbacteria bacterium]|nr:protein translocase subunit SecD [Candidatus Uhrbacteria bacterium]